MTTQYFLQWGLNPPRGTAAERHSCKGGITEQSGGSLRRHAAKGSGRESVSGAERLMSWHFRKVQRVYWTGIILSDPLHPDNMTSDRKHTQDQLMDWRQSSSWPYRLHTHTCNHMQAWPGLSLATAPNLPSYTGHIQRRTSIPLLIRNLHSLRLLFQPHYFWTICHGIRSIPPVSVQKTPQHSGSICF